MVTTKKPEITEYTMKLANKIIVYEFTNGKGAVDPKTYKKGTNNNRWFRAKADETLQEISTGFLCDYLNIRMNTLDVDKIGYLIYVYKANSKRWFMIYNTLQGLKSKRFKIIES